MTSNKGDTLSNLFESIHELYTRFNVDLFDVDTGRIFNEEAYEFTQALNDFQHDYQDNRNRASVLDEAADVLYTLLGALYAERITVGELEQAIERIIVKNDSKTHETHEYVNGKIRRKG